MHPRTLFRSLILLLCAAALCASLGAQSERTITLRLLDGKTGKPIVVSNFLVRINHDPTVHANWATQNEDGSYKLTLPGTATLLTLQATYDSAEEIYLNCDAAGEKSKADAHWYDLATILSTGLAATDGCIRPRQAAKFKVAAKPGEFVFFARRKSILEEASDDFSDH